MANRKGRKKGAKDLKPRKKRRVVPVSMRSHIPASPEQVEKWQDEIEERRINAEHAAFRQAILEDIERMERNLVAT